MSGSISILLVDDEIKLLERISRILLAENYNVATAANYQDAVSLLNSQYFHILITDLNMPDSSGFELMEYIRNKNIQTLPLVLTGYASVEGAIKAIKLGAYDFLEKPVEVRTIQHTVKRAAERIILKQENEQHIRELKKLDKMKNEFLSIVSHDIRSPLSSIGGYANHLLKKGELSDFQHRYLLIIKEISDNLYSLVNEILDISKIEKGIIDLNYERCEIEDLVSSSINNFILLAVDKNNKIKFYNTLKNPYAYVDRMKILQVCNNLIANAIKFTENGQIILALSDTDEDSVSITVQDTGIGMSKEEVDNIFNQYNYYHKDGTRGEKGNGLGIVICKRFIDLHGGSLTVHSTPGVGTEFQITLPRDVTEIEEKNE